MKFILSAYNYFPDHSGGTEVYVHKLAGYLRKQGHDVLIIAAGEWTGNEETVVPGDIVRWKRYAWNDDDILAVQFTGSSLRHIYANYDPAWENFFETRLKALQWNNADHLLINGLNSVSGLALARAVRKLTPSVRVSVLHHTAFLCPKGDLLNAFTGRDCGVRVNGHQCNSCYLKERLRQPAFLVSGISVVLGLIGRFMPGRALFRMEYLFSLRLSALQQLYSMTDRCIVFSEGMRQFLSAQHWIDEASVKVVRHGFDTALFQGREGETRNGPLIFTYAGRFEKVKGVDVLTRAWLGNREEPEKRRLCLVGNWENSETGRWVHRTLGHRSDVLFLGNMSQEDLSDQFRKTDCVIIPSRCVETGPLVFHEAIGAGCHVLSSDIGGQKELAEMYVPMTTVFRNEQSPDLGRRIMEYRRSEQKPRVRGMHWDAHFGLLMKSIYES